jgi:hypothetical protein
MLLWTFVYSFLCGHMFSMLLDIHQGVEQQGPVVTVFSFLRSCQAISHSSYTILHPAGYFPHVFGIGGLFPGMWASLSLLSGSLSTCFVLKLPEWQRDCQELPGSSPHCHWTSWEVRWVCRLLIFTLSIVSMVSSCFCLWIICWIIFRVQ